MTVLPLDPEVRDRVLLAARPEGQLEFSATPAQRIVTILGQRPTLLRQESGGHTKDSSRRFRNSRAVPCSRRARVSSSSSVIEAIRLPGRTSPSGKG